jgi:hypothetical protein
MTQERTLDPFEEYEQEQARNGYVVPERLSQGSFDRNTEVTFGEAFGAAVETGTTATIGNMFEEWRAGNRGNRVDPRAYIKSSPNLSMRFDQLPEEYREKLLEAETDQEIEAALVNAEQNWHYQQVLQNAGGFTSFGAQVAAGLIDPTEWGIALSTGGLGNLAMKGKTLGTGARMALAGLEGGTANVAITGILAQQNPTLTWEDAAAAFVVGSVISAPFGVKGRADSQRTADAMGKYAREVVLKDLPQTFDRRTYMRKNRAAESSGRDTAAATTSSAYGRYQFLKDTWVTYYKKTFGKTGETREQILAKRADGDTQDRVMETFTRENEFRLKQNGIAVNDTTLYLMHFLGEGDALKVLKARANEPAAKYVRKASRDANATVFTKGLTVQGLIDWAARKMKAGSVAPTGTGTSGASTLADAADDVSQSVSASFAREEARLADDADEALDDFNNLGSFNEIRQSVGAAAKGVDDVEYFGSAITIPGSYARYLGKRVPAEIRQTFGSLMNSLSRKDNNTREIAAEVTARRFHDGMLAKAYKDYNPHFREWAKANGYGIIRQELTSEPQQQFMREVTRAMRGATDVSPQAQAAGAALAKGYKDALMEAKRARLPGFEDINPNANYVPRLINDRKLMQVFREVDMDGVKLIIRNALMGAGMEEDLANRVARAYAEGSVDRAISPQRRGGSMRGIADDDIERLRYYLPDSDDSLVDEVIASLKSFRERRNPDGGRIDRAKFRLEMDELSETVINGKTYRITDLFEDDAWQLYERYTRTLSGWIGLAERANVRSDAEWDQLVKGLKERNAGDPKITEYLTRLEEVKELTLGRSIVNENGTLRRSAQLVRKLNFAATMGQAGMASFAELGNVVAYGGMKNMMMHLPLFRNFWSQARAGQLDKGLVDELNNIGIGMKLRLGRGRAGVDEFGDPIENHLFDTADRILDPFSRAVSHVGLLGPMNDFLQMLAARSFVQKIGGAKGLDSFTPGELLRLRDAGFHDGVLERAIASIKEHGTFDGKRVVGLGIDKWDRDIALDFKDAIANMTYRAVQENDIGSSAWWMHTGLGRMLTQFRSFVFNALIKQSVYSARFAFSEGRPDGQVFAAFALTMFFGGISYVGRNYMNSFGRDDQEEYLEKRIGSLDAVARGAFNATGYASILPGAIDTAIYATGNLGGAVEGPLFAQGRTTGLGSDFINGNPTYRLYRAAEGTVRAGFMVPQEEYDFSQDDLRRLQSLTPMGNVTGIRNVFALMAQDLPENSQEDEYWQ